MPVNELPHLTRDKESQRWQYKRRWPKECKGFQTTRYVVKFRKALTDEQVMDAWLAANREYDRKVGIVRDFPEMVAVGKQIDAITQTLPYLKTLVAALDAENAADSRRAAEREYEVNLLKLAQLGDADARAEFAARFNIPLQGAVPVEPQGGVPVTIDRVLEAWANEYRDRDPQRRVPSDKALQAKRGVLLYMFEARRKAEDLRGITETDLKQHRAYLLSDDRKPGRKGNKLPNAHAHIEELKTCFNVADRNGLLGDMPNPAAKLQHISKAEVTRMDFTAAERAAILTAAREAHPQVKWAHYIAAYTSAIPTELRFLTPSHFRVEDGVQVVDIRPAKGSALKTQYRPRTVPLHPALVAEGLLSYVETIRREGGDDALLFGYSAALLSDKINAVIHRLKAAGAVADDPLKSFYSHRHTILTELDGRLILDDEGRKVDASYLVGGHAPPDIHKKHYVHVKMPRLLAAIETLAAV
ncbi:MAG TPA: hypothetical protein VHY35_10405 [Stellaceae bacterium]|jgi:integrase|nr:hypothetical protein [Stellaceae bacterium]